MTRFPAADSVSVLVFDVGGRTFGLRAADIVELVRAVAITPLPGAPPVVEGVFDLRGRLVPVLDIRARFRLAAAPLDPGQLFVIARAGSRSVAFRADRAHGLVTPLPGEVEDLRAVAPGIGFFPAAARLADGVVLIHDPGSFLTADETVDLDRLLSPEGGHA